MLLLLLLLVVEARAALNNSNNNNNTNNNGSSFFVRLDTSPPRRRGECPLPYAVNFIQVPRAAGATVQRVLRRGVARCGGASFGHNNPYYATCNDDDANTRELRRGNLYDGHAPIGWSAANFDAMAVLYVVVMREPASLMVSLYDYTVTFAAYMEKPKARTVNWLKNPVYARSLEMSEAEIRLAVYDDVPAGQYLDELFRRRQYGFSDMDFAIESFLVPCRPQQNCSTGGSGETHQLFATAMHNLLRVDVVAVVDELEETLVPQLEYHLGLALFAAGAPTADGAKKELLPRENAVRRVRQRLSPAAYAVLRATPAFRRATRLYLLSKDIARVRAARAKDATTTTPHPADVPLSEADYDLLTSTTALRASPCVVPPRFAWPSFFHR